jgi:hypothetical protein
MRAASLLCCLFLLLEGNALCQTIEGKVINAQSKEPLPYASISLSSKKNIGTVSNQEGKFTIAPSNAGVDTLTVSYIGFKKKKVVIKKGNKSPVTIALLPYENILNEVVIVSEDTLIRLIRHAFENIEKNYPPTGTLIKGFYRETNQLLPEKKFLYFSESVIDFYKPSYQNKQLGPVRILEGGKAEVASRTDFSRTYFYAGPYVPQRFDFVKKREEFINPIHFKKYEYRVEGKSTDGDREVYIIRFIPKSNASFDGKFVLDATTLAYIEAEYKLSPHGLMKENINLSAFNFRNRNFTVKYRLVEGRWNISLVFQDGVGSVHGKNQIRYTNEFVSTSFEPMSTNPIREGEAIPFSGVYTNVENKFSDNFWKKPEVISRTNDLENTVDLLFNRKNVIGKDSVFSGKSNQDSIMLRKEKKSFTQIMSKVSDGVALGLSPVSSIGGFYHVSLQNVFSITRQITNRSAILSGGLELKYFTGKNTGIIFKQQGDFDKNEKFVFSSLGADWRIRITGWKRPLYFNTGINFYHARSFALLGNTASANIFEAGRTSIDSKKINVGIGEIRYGVLPSMQLVYKIGNQFSIYTEIQTSVYSWSKDKVLIQEMSGSLFRRHSATIDLQTKGLLVERDGVASPTGTHLNDRQIFVFFGLRSGIR